MTAINLMWAGIAVTIAGVAAIVAAFARVWRRDALAGRHAAIPQAPAVDEEDGLAWWLRKDGGTPAVLPAALAPVPRHSGDYGDWTTGAFTAADAALVKAAALEAQALNGMAAGVRPGTGN